MSHRNVDRKNIAISFAETELIFDSSGALYWPTHNILVLADMHLEKGSYHAMQGNPLPLYDTFDTLMRLLDLIRLYKPQTIITLGDNIHDVRAFLRMSKENNSLLQSVSLEVEQWIWLIGNHDRQTLPPSHNNMFFHSHYQVDNIYFSHDIHENNLFQIVGHYHPKITVKSIKGKCFVANKQTIIMPSFGTYTGGLSINSSVFKKVIGKEKYKVYLLHQNKIWQVL